MSIEERRVNGSMPLATIAVLALLSVGCSSRPAAPATAGYASAEPAPRGSYQLESVDGRPLPAHVPVPRHSMLTIEEYESLLQSLPNEADWENAPARALATLQAWARANPDLARLEPARTILRGARDEADRLAAHQGT